MASWSSPRAAICPKSARWSTKTPSWIPSAEKLADLIEKKTGFETRSVNLGHTQRGGVPTAYDRILGQRYGLHAIDMVHDQKWGRIAVLRGLDITDIPIKDAIATNRRLDQRFFDVISDLEVKV